MPDTARLHGLTLRSGIDDCLDVPKLTRAAARYLRELRARFGDWSLALATNHVGEAVIQSAVLKSGSRDFGLFSSSPRGSGGLTHPCGHRS
jgi:membrane-bound lytic murein transglycosylase D